MNRYNLRRILWSRDDVRWLLGDGRLRFRLQGLPSEVWYRDRPLYQMWACHSLPSKNTTRLTNVGSMLDQCWASIDPTLAVWSYHRANGWFPTQQKHSKGGQCYTRREKTRSLVFADQSAVINTSVFSYPLVLLPSLVNYRKSTWVRRMPMVLT